MNESCKIFNGRHLPVMRTVSIREVPTLPRESVGVIMRSYPVAVASIMPMVAWIPPARRPYINMVMAIIFIGYWLDMEKYVRVLVRSNIARR